MQQADVPWVFWRPVKHGLARSILEVRREWTLVDLLEAHQALDVEADIEQLVANEQERRFKMAQKKH